MRIGLVLTALLIQAPVTVGYVRQVGDERERPCVIDEGPNVADFARFRREMHAVVRARDASRLSPYLAPDIRMEGRTIADCRRSFASTAFRIARRSSGTS
jgi:hypothetical protein